MEKKAEIITDKNGKKLVRIPEILFKGKRQIPWGDVKKYLERYVGMACEIATGKCFRKNSGEKHRKDAAYGWYLYDILDIKKETSNPFQS